MLYGFDTHDDQAAVGALLAYGVYRSRDRRKFKVTPDMWGIISRAVSGCAFRSIDLWEFIEKLSPKLQCSALNPHWMKVDTNPVISVYVDRETGEVIERGKQQPETRRQFWTDILQDVEHEAVLTVLAHKTSLVIALVRDRLEREKPYEPELIAKVEAEGGEVIDAEEHAI